MLTLFSVCTAKASAFQKKIKTSFDSSFLVVLKHNEPLVLLVINLIFLQLATHTKKQPVRHQSAHAAHIVKVRSYRCNNVTLSSNLAGVFVVSFVKSCWRHWSLSTVVSCPVALTTRSWKPKATYVYPRDSSDPSVSVLYDQIKL